SGALNAGGDARVESVSCASAGNCAAGGVYADRLGPMQAVVGSETDGPGGPGDRGPRPGGLDRGRASRAAPGAGARAGDTPGGGRYRDSSAGFQAFVVSETNGSWGTAIEVPGSGALNAGGFAGVNSVSCRSAGKCAAGGTYTDGSGHIQAFVASQA